ncbi:MAG: M23 family metallopeptidase [Sphingobium sp.]|nr:M23 family metallopeptidase [Sphingobium sp.]
MTVTRRAFVSGLMTLPLAGRAFAEESNPFHLSGLPRQGVALRGTVPHDTMLLMLNDLRIDFTHDGQFLIAFDRDAPSEAVLRAETQQDIVIEQRLAVAPGNWQIEQVDAPLLGGAQSSEEFQKLRAGELEQIVAARAVRSDSDGWRQNFIWPVKARISGRFGAQRIYRGTPAAYHNGVDLAGGLGTTYVAPADGVVVLAAAQPFTLEGNLLILDHGEGLNSALLHSQELLVKLGDKVKQGQPLGRIGATGRVSGPHLHWAVKWRDARIDPATFVVP